LATRLPHPNNCNDHTSNQAAAEQLYRIWITLRGLFVTDPLIILATIFFGLASMLASFRDFTGRKQAALAKIWAQSLLAVSGVNVQVEGLEHVHAHTNYVFVANHTSYMDTPVILSCLSAQCRFLAKSSLFRIPFLGWHLARAGHIPVPLGDPRASVKSMQRAAEAITQKSISLLIFPEGGRTQDGALQPFKEGAASIAIRAGVPVIPIALIGVRDALPFGTSIVLSTKVVLRILKPIDTSEFTLKDRGKLTATLHHMILEQLQLADRSVLRAL
jgi:1-acyl-sn-glycerol-3-phosphate acyltransferase